MGLKEILARRLTSVVLLLVIAGSIWWANGRPVSAPELSADCLAWRETVQKEARSYRGLGSEERSLMVAIKSNAGSKPEGCPLPAHL